MYQVLVWYQTCKVEFLKSYCIIFNRLNYDLTSDHVHKIFCDVTIEQTETCYLCKECHNSLKQTLICACCHQELSKRSSTIFDEQTYDFTNYVVSKSLASHIQYRYTSGDKYMH